MKSSFLKFKIIKQALLACFIISMVIVSCKKDSTPPPPADKTSLTESIDTAQMLIDSTVEGTKPGEYEVGSKDSLTTELATSKTILNDNRATQAEVNNATALLNTTIAAYRGHYIPEVAAKNLIGYWKMNGNANDSSGNGNNGTVTMGLTGFGAGTPVLTKDRFGRDNMAYHFDHGGNIKVPYDSLLNPTEMTISLWVNWLSSGRTIYPNRYVIMGNMTDSAEGEFGDETYYGYIFRLLNHLPETMLSIVNPVHDPLGIDTALFNNDDGGIAVAENTWTHLAFTFKPGSEVFYIDGNLVKKSGIYAQDYILNYVGKQNISIGSSTFNDGFYGGFWTGDLDDVMLYNVALTADQIKSIYNNQKTL